MDIRTQTELKLREFMDIRTQTELKLQGVYGH